MRVAIGSDHAGFAPTELLRREPSEELGDDVTAFGPDPAEPHRYPAIAIPPPPPNRNGADIDGNNFTVLPPDPNGLDGNNDGVGCQS